ETGRLAGQGEGDAAARLLGDLLARHHGVAQGLVRGAALDALTAQLTKDFTELTEHLRGWATLGEVSPRATDEILAMGELASSRMVAAAFAAQNIPVAWVDSRKVLVTDDEHTAAVPDTDATCRRTRELVASRTAAGEVP